MLFPLFLKLAGRDVLVVGAGPIGTSKARSLLEAGARVTVVAPEAQPEVRELAAAGALVLHARAFADADVDGAWLVVAAATPDVNRAVASASEARRTFVLAVDDPTSASAYGAGVVRRGGVTVAVSTDGRAPALAGLLREALEAVLPDELASWTAEAERLRGVWKTRGVPMAERRPLLLEALNQLYAEREAKGAPPPANEAGEAPSGARVSLVGAGPGDPELITVRGARRLAEAGFACEIVPGISSAVAAPALAGIPVTHRGMASSFAVVTGHHEETYGPLLASFAPGSLTLVVMMGLRQRARVAELLVARGWDRATPAAIVVGAATPEAWSWTGTLEGLGAAEIPHDAREAPGLLVVGEVVSLAGALRLESATAPGSRSLA